MRKIPPGVYLAAFVILVAYLVAYFVILEDASGASASYSERLKKVEERQHAEAQRMGAECREALSLEDCEALCDRRFDSVNDLPSAIRVCKSAASREPAPELAGAPS